MTPRQVSALSQRAREVQATDFQIRCAASLAAIHGLPYALGSLDGCRAHFETVAQVRAFLRGRRWSQRDTLAVRITVVRQPGLSKFVLHADSDPMRAALQQLFANTNVAMSE